MTTTTHQHTTEKYYISIEQENTLLTVSVCPFISDRLYGYPIIKATYHHTELDKAIRTFKRYIKKYSEV